MSSTGVRPFAAPLSKLTIAAVILAANVRAACPPAPASPQETRAQVEQLDKAAQAAMQNQKYAQAVQHFREIVCLAPNSAREFYGLGAAEAASGDFLSARKSLRTADRLEPANVLPLTMLVRVNVAMNDVDSLKAVLREAASRFPNDAELHGSLARFLAGKDQLDLALAEALRARSGATDAESTVGLAVLENSAGAYDDAIHNAQLIEGQAGAPASLRASAAGVAGLSYESAGKPEQAIAGLRHAIELDPSRETSYLALAMIYTNANQLGDAVKVLRQGLEKIPSSTALLLPLGTNLVRSGQYQSGIDVLQRLLLQSPNETGAYLQIADASHKLGNFNREVQVLQDLAEHKPDYPMIHVLIARAMLSVTPVNAPAVANELDLAEKAAPADPDIPYLRGKLDVATNRYEDAIASFQRAIELRPMDSATYYQLARAYQKLGNTDLAKQAFERMNYAKENEAVR
jgi:tetratricopeptide (TPR) repeat protein